MPPKGALPSCGFAVGGTKKGELQLRVEKRARGKKVTIIPNVTGDASKLVRALQTMLGVGGTARHAEKGFWVVEVQGDQVPRVTKALLDFACLRGISDQALRELREQQESVRKDAKEATSVVDRNAATKFLKQTQDGAPLSVAEERRRALEMEAEFYGRFWSDAVSPSDDFDSDIWQDSTFDDAILADGGESASKYRPGASVQELNVALNDLGILAECGKAVRDFWQGTKMSIAQFKKMALNPGARDINYVPGRKNKPTNLIARQKISDFKSGATRANYFSFASSVIDDYEKGISRTREEREAEKEAEQKRIEAQESQLSVSTGTDGWCNACLSYCAPLPVPSTMLDDEERHAVAKDALRVIEASINEELAMAARSVPGVECKLDCDTFGFNLWLREQDFLHAPKPEAGSGKAASEADKEEMKLEKKLREICNLRRRQAEGETLEKLQAEKVARREDLYRQVAERKIRRAEKEILKVFKRSKGRFQDEFWKLEWNAQYGEGNSSGSRSSPAAAAAQQAPKGFDEGSRDSRVTIGPDGATAESRAPQWAGGRLHLELRQGEVAAFEVKVLKGLVRMGWVTPKGSFSDLGSTKGSYGFGGTGRKATGGAFEPYGEAFGDGDIIHCEAEREDGRLRIGFAKNSEPLGIAFDVEDSLDAHTPLIGAVCGKNFKVQLISVESMAIEDADEDPGLEGFQEFDPPRMAVAQRNFAGEGDDNLTLWVGETVQVASDDGEGWLFGFFLDPEDPEDGGWFPADVVKFLDEDGGDEEDAGDSWGAAPSAEPIAPGGAGDDGAWGAAPAADEALVAPAWGDDVPAFAPPARSGGSAAADPTEVAADADELSGALGEWLRGLSLSKYERQALEWCEEMGAVSLEEVIDNWEDFAEAMAFKNLERKRLEKAVKARAQ